MRRNVCRKTFSSGTSDLWIVEKCFKYSKLCMQFGNEIKPINCLITEWLITDFYLQCRGFYLRYPEYILERLSRLPASEDAKMNKVVQLQYISYLIQFFKLTLADLRRKGNKFEINSKNIVNFIIKLRPRKESILNGMLEYSNHCKKERFFIFLFFKPVHLFQQTFISNDNFFP